MQKTDFMNAVSKFEYPNFPHYMLQSWSRGKVFGQEPASMLYVKT